MTKQEKIDIAFTGTVSFLILGLMISAFSISYTTMKSEAERYGITTNPANIPIIVDGAILVFTGLMIWGHFRQEAEATSYGQKGIVGATLLTLFFNISHAPYVRAIADHGFSSVEDTWASIVLQTLYAAVSPAMLALALHALAIMLERIVEASKQLADLIQQLATERTARQQAETKRDELDTEVQSVKDKIVDSDKQLKIAVNAQQEAEKREQQLIGELKATRKQVQEYERKMNKYALAVQFWDAAGQTAREFFVRVWLLQQETASQFASEFKVDSAILSRTKKLLEIPDDE